MKPPTGDTSLPAWTLLAVSETANVFGNMGSNLAQIRAEAVDHETCERHRSAYRPAAGVALVSASVISWISGSWLPLAASAATMGVMVHIYESHMPHEYRKDAVSALIGGPSLAVDVADLGLSRPYQSEPTYISLVPNLPAPSQVSGGTSIQFANGPARQEVF